MTFNAKIPQATDLISNSQASLLSNNQFLGSTTGNTANGYYKLPNGLIMQWNFIAPTNSATVTVSFPTAFASAVYSVQVTRTRATGNFPSNTTFDYWVDKGTVSTTGFNIINNDGHTWGYYWFAIGV